MFCPRCGLPVSDDLKFCRRCGANLRGVREALLSNSTEEGLAPGQNPWTNMMSAAVEAKRRLDGTPEEKRLNEIKAGVITSLGSFGLMIFLRFFLNVVAEQNPPHDAEIIRHVWLVGIVPLLVGVGIIFNGLFISRRLVQLKEQQMPPVLPAMPEPIALPAKTTDQLAARIAPAESYSVIEDTTAHLPEPVAAPQRRENS
jgi:hypothetical protein